jgi:hypothetical protein
MARGEPQQGAAFVLAPVDGGSGIVSEFSLHFALAALFACEAERRSGWTSILFGMVAISNAINGTLAGAIAFLEWLR